MLFSDKVIDERIYYNTDYVIYMEDKMKKIISDVVNFPTDCETVRFTAC